MTWKPRVLYLMRHLPEEERNRKKMIKKRRLSLMVKVNILIVTLVLLTAGLMFVSSERTFRQTVLDPCAQRMERMQRAADSLKPYVSSFLAYLGTEKLSAVLAQDDKDRTRLREWMAGQPSMNDDEKTATLLEDYDRFFLRVEALRAGHQLDSVIAQVEKDGKTFIICYADNLFFLLDLVEDTSTLEYFGIEEPTPPPADYATPRIVEDESDSYMLHCARIDMEGGNWLNLWSLLDMREIVRGHRQFIVRSILFTLGLTVLSSVISILLMRRHVAHPIQRLARATKAFTPEEDGTYSEDKIISENIRKRDEIGDLSRDIRAMQTGIVENTRKLAAMTAEKERIRTELEMANMIQASALPHTFPAFPDRKDFSIYASMTPAKEVGGDFYDFFLIDDTHLGIVMADVSDKGVPAALFMMTSRTLIQIYAKMKLSPSETLSAANEWLCANNREAMFVTVWFGILDLSTGIITAVNAGHEYPVVRSGGGPFRLLRDRHGFIVGATPNVPYKEYEIRLAPGDRLFLYTDGIPESQTAGREMFGTDRMVAALNEDPDATPEQLLSNVRSAVDRFIAGARQYDDMTMLCLEYRDPFCPSAG